MRAVIYLKPETSEADLRRLAAEAARAPGVSSVEPVTAAAARKRFQDVFPSLSNLDCNRLVVGGNRSARVHSKLAADNKLAAEHNRRAGHNTGEDNTPAAAGNRDRPDLY